MKHCKRHNIRCFHSINTSISNQKAQQSLKSWSNFSLVLFDKGREIYVITLLHPYSIFERTMQQRSDRLNDLVTKQGNDLTLVRLKRNYQHSLTETHEIAQSIKNQVFFFRSFRSPGSIVSGREEGGLRVESGCQQCLRHTLTARLTSVSPKFDHHHQPHHHRNCHDHQ